MLLAETLLSIYHSRLDRRTVQNRVEKIAVANSIILFSVHAPQNRWILLDKMIRCPPKHWDVVLLWAFILVQMVPQAALTQKFTVV